MSTSKEMDELIRLTRKTCRNYKIKELNCQSNVCIVFFSSNVVYYPDEAIAYKKQIIEQDRYEWERMVEKSNALQAYIKKAIFLRDVYKSWYFCGVNEEIDDLRKLIALIGKEAKGPKLITVGSSAGGYAAILVGTVLGAHRIIASSPQISLDKYYNTSKTNTIISQLDLEDWRRKYIDISDLINEESQRLVCLFPSRFEVDNLQDQLVKSERVKKIHIKSNQHGRTVINETWTVLLTKEYEWFTDLPEKEYYRFEFAYILLDRKLLKTIQVICIHMKNRMRHYVKKGISKLNAKVKS